MSQEIGALRVALSANAAQFEADLKAAAKAVKGASQDMQSSMSSFHAKMQAIGRGIQDFSKSVAKVGAGLSAAVTAPLTMLGKESLDAYLQAEKAAASMEATLRSMGDASGKTSEELKALASHFQAITVFDDDTILQKVIGQLLTFGQIANEEFDRAAKVALDLSQKLGQDLQQSAIMVGKALNDPVRGLTALQRVGIVFSEDQKELIKGFVEQGEVAKAQGVILEELERQFGGVAEAMAQTAEGQLTQLSNSWGDFQEELGAVIVEILPPLVDILRDIVAALNSMDDETKKAIVVIGGLAAAVGPVLGVLGSLGMALGALVAAGTGPVILVTAAVAALVVAWREWDQIAPIVQAMVEGVKEWLLGPLLDAFEKVRSGIESVKGWFQGMYDAVVGHSYVPDMVRGVADWFARMRETMIGETSAGVGGVNRQMALLDRAGEDAMYTLGRGFRDLIHEGKSFSDVLAGILDQLAEIAMQWSLSSLSAGGGFGQFLAPLLGGLAGFQHGGSFVVGGSGGIDSSLVAFRATPGELVTVSTPEQVRQASGGSTYYIDARGADREGMRRLEALIVQLDGSIERRAVGAVAQEAQRNAGYRRALGSR